jgi:hypothetical protein
MALLGLTMLAAADGASASSVPTVRPVPAQSRPLAAPRSTMDLEASYVLETRLHYRAARLEVNETVTIVNRSPDTIDALHLSILARPYGEFRLRSVAVDDVGVSVTFPNRADMLVRLPRNLDPGSRTELEVQFSAHPSRDVRDSLHARLSKAEGMMRVADWFPILSNGHGLRNPGDSQFTVAATSITLDLTTDQNLDVAAPGALVEHHGRHRVYLLEHARNYGFTVAPRLRMLTGTTRDGVRVRVFHPRGVNGAAALREARRALETFDDAYGRYPWPELIVAPTPGTWFATESPSLVFLGAGRFADAEVVHHEVAHQWFYALLGNDQLHEPWLDEALAEFSTRYFFGSWDRRYCSRRKVDSAVYQFPDTFDRWGCDSYVDTVYLKGAAMVDGVRARLGNSRFFGAMRTLVREHRFGLLTSTALVGTWLRFSPKPRALSRYLARFLSHDAVAESVVVQRAEGSLG